MGRCRRRIATKAACASWWRFSAASSTARSISRLIASSAVAVRAIGIELAQAGFLREPGRPAFSLVGQPVLLSGFHRARPQFHGPGLHHGRLIRLRQAPAADYGRLSPAKSRRSLALERFCLPIAIMVNRSLPREPPVTASNAATPFSPDEIVPLPVVQQLALGQELQSQGRLDEAVAAFRSGLAAIGDGINQVVIATRAELHAGLGNAFMARGDLDAGGRQLQGSAPARAEHDRLLVQPRQCAMQTGNAQDAIPLYLQALKLNPSHWPARTNLAQALIATGQMVVAKALLQ